MNSSPLSSRKNTVYLVMALAHETGLIAGQALSQDRGLETLQALADTLPAAQRYAMDGHSAYYTQRQRLYLAHPGLRGHLPLLH